MWQARSTTELASNLGEKEVPILLTHYSFSEYNWVEFELTLNIYIYIYICHHESHYTHILNLILTLTA